MRSVILASVLVTLPVPVQRVIQASRSRLRSSPSVPCTTPQNIPFQIAAFDIAAKRVGVITQPAGVTPPNEPCVHCVPGHYPSTPVHVSALEAELVNHPDTECVNSLISGMRHGFCIGYDGPCDTLISPNLSSATDNPSLISEYLANECALGHTAGPFDVCPFDPFQSAGIGIVPKKSGGFRLIVHLSAPLGQNINDGIDEDLYSLEYTTVDDIVKHVIRQGRGALLYKVDMQHTLCNIPVHPSDWPLLGMVRDGQYYFDKVLPFGLCSSPAIFNKFAEAVCWILRNEYNLPGLEHYLDDFLALAHPQIVFPHLLQLCTKLLS